MNRWLIPSRKLATTLALWMIILALLLTGCAQATTNAQGDTNAKVVKVVDGDTLDVSFNGKTERVRLLLVDTPETVHPSKPVEPFGPEASKFAKETLTNQNVKVELDASERDKYGRLLAYIWVNGKMFNEMLLEQGLARVAYVYPPNVKYVDQFREIQKTAQKKAIGIWSIENYATDKGFNDNVAKSTESSKTGASSKSGTSAKSSATNTEDSKSTKTSAVPSSGDGKQPLIKGNINSKGEKIYHMPGGAAYNATKAEQMFYTEKEAQAAGFRKASR